MKIKKLLYTFLLASNYMFSQSYSFSVSNSLYSNLTGSTSLNNGVLWDDPNFTFPIGFNFQLFNTTFNTLYFHPDGVGSIITQAPVPSNSMPALLPINLDIVDRGIVSGSSLSNLSYKLEGIAPNRILKVEWNNIGFLGDLYVNNSSTDFANFQVWLYETSNIFEYRYGSSSISFPALSFDGNLGPGIAAFPLVDFNSGLPSPGIVLSGNTVSPTVNNNTTAVLYVNGMPSSGTVYRFSPTFFNLSENKLINSFQIYPNPTSKNININNLTNKTITNIEIFDTLGKKYCQVVTILKV